MLRLRLIAVCAFQAAALTGLCTIQVQGSLEATSMTVHILTFACNRDIDETPKAFEADSPVGGLLKREERDVPASFKWLSHGVGALTLITTRGHHYIDVRTSHCAGQVPVMSLRGDEQSYSAALKQGYQGEIDQVDAWMAGCFDASGITGVTLVSDEVRCSARISNNCYYLDPQALRRWWLTITMSDSRTVVLRVPANFIKHRNYLENISLADIHDAIARSAKSRGTVPTYRSRTRFSGAMMREARPTKCADCAARGPVANVPASWAKPHTCESSESLRLSPSMI